ncbi:MAG: helix-turn-helix domain-containing protein [Methyloceanibacter sp.]
MTLRQVADYLHCAYSTACRLVRQGEIPGFKLGGGWRFMKSEIDRWIAKGAARK